MPTWMRNGACSRSRNRYSACSRNGTVDALQAMRGIALINAVVLVAESVTSHVSQTHASSWPISAWSPVNNRVVRPSGAAAFPTPATLMRGARWSRRLGLPDESAHWPAQGRPDRGAAESRRDIGWKAQVRLSTRYHNRLSARGKNANVVNVAGVREMGGFIWSAACTDQSAPKASSLFDSQPAGGPQHRISVGAICGAGGGTMPGSPRIHYEPRPLPPRQRQPPNETRPCGPMRDC